MYAGNSRGPGSAKAYQNACLNAFANANYFNRPYCLFIDTSGNYRVERYVSQCDPIHTFHPIPSGADLAAEIGKLITTAENQIPSDKGENP